MALRRELPERRMESARRDRVKVDSGSLIYVDRNAYSVPSRLIGEQVEARLFMDHVEVWYPRSLMPQTSTFLFIGGVTGRPCWMLATLPMKKSIASSEAKHLNLD